MALRLVVLVFLTYILLLAFTLTSFGQQNAQLSMEAIPKALRWDNHPKSFRIEKSGIVIIAGEKTDMFRDPNVTYNTDNAPKLMFDADSNFVFTASIEHGFTNKWDGGAIILKQDSLNWVKFCFEKDYTGARRVVSVVTKGISDDCNSVEISSDKVFYKIAKAGNVITLYYSLTGVTWFLVRHFTFDFNKGVQLGFLAQSPLGKECKVQFRNVHYSTKKINNPYSGD